MPFLGDGPNRKSMLSLIADLTNESFMLLLIKNPSFRCRTQLRETFLAARLAIRAHHRLRAREPVTDPRSVGQHELEPVRPHHARNSGAMKLARIGP